MTHMNDAHVKISPRPITELERESITALTDQIDQFRQALSDLTSRANIPVSIDVRDPEGALISKIRVHEPREVPGGDLTMTAFKNTFTGAPNVQIALADDINVVGLFHPTTNEAICLMDSDAVKTLITALAEQGMIAAHEEGASA